MPALMALAAAGLLLALAGPGCSATNFLDPEGPRYYETGRSAMPGHSVAAAGEPLRIVTFNIEFGREIEGALQLLQSSDALRRPDLLLLQEMSGAGVVRIATGLGLNHLYYPSGIHPQARQEYGTAILSPWPIEEPDKLMLPHGAAITGMRRAVTTATVRWRGRRVRVYSVHLPAPLSISLESREAQVELIVGAARRHPGPVIVAGDFNGRSVGPWFERGGFTWITENLGGTSRGPGFWLSLDHVFARGLRAAAGSLSEGVVQADGISDHRAVWALLAEAGAPNPTGQKPR